jgi:hypothetical protein
MRIIRRKKNLQKESRVRGKEKEGKKRNEGKKKCAVGESSE